MPSKKVFAIIIISIITAGTLVALTPVFIYGFGVNALSFDMSLGVLGTTSQISPSQDSYQFDDFGSTSTITINAKTVKVNPYEYFFRQWEGDVKTDGNSAFALFNQYVDIVIFINISTPTGGSYELTFTLEDLANIFMQNTNILLGPDEIQIVSGTYEVWVNVVVTINIPDLTYSETFESGVFYAAIDVVVE